MAEESARHTAVHEAGHAVIAVKLGLPCEGVTIDRDDDSEGHALVPDQWEIIDAWEKRQRWREERTALVGRILAYMAGAEAEIEILGKCAGGDGDDRLWISRMLEYLPASSPDILEARLRRHTRVVVKRHRELIVHLANILEQRQAIDTGELLAAASRAGGAPPPGRGGAARLFAHPAPHHPVSNWSRRSR